MRSPVRALLAATVLLGGVALAPPASADPSAWVFVGAGPLGWKQSDAAFTTSGAMSFDVGVGTTPEARLIAGGLFRKALEIIDKTAGFLPEGFLQLHYFIFYLFIGVFGPLVHVGEVDLQV